ncbi:PAS domain-containing protein [Desertibaculum subflavum]|uniref:PAS domain-containing protein n=1 Tax=Desertibaculum subflavum TaxID=2268458 RepID=UPI000E65F5E2
MTKYMVAPTGRERTFGEDEIIVSKTDTSGRLLYVNDVFCRVGLYTESELIGQPHSIVRHPDMPRAVFKLLWDTIQKGEELFAYVKNMAKNGDHYWVLAHVTPSYDGSGRIIGFHSNRRVPERSALAVIEPVYQQLLAEENRHANRKDGLAAAEQMLAEFLRSQNTEYDRFIFATLKAA